MTETLWTVDVGLCLTRPVREQRVSRVTLMATSAEDAELTAISMAVLHSRAEMATGSTIIDWEE